MTLPEVEPVLPATDAPLDGSIEMTFSESIATAGTVSLNNGIGTLTAAGANLSGNTYTMSYAGLAYSTGYTITITGFQDAAGNTMAENGTHSFTTKAPPSTASVDAERNKFLRLLHGGSEVDAAQYAATEGGMVITLSEPYLRTFANGSYTFRTEFTDWYTDLTLTVAIEASAPPSSPQPDNVPKTGDDSHGDMWTMLLVVSGLCMADIALWYRWRQRKKTRA